MMDEFEDEPSSGNPSGDEVLPEGRLFKSWWFVWKIHHVIVRDWFAELKVQEKLAMIFVFDRTLGWGKQWERISRKQCVIGIFDYDGERIATGFASNHDRAGKVLSALVEKGFLLRKPTEKPSDNSYLYSINYEKAALSRWVDEETREQIHRYGSVPVKDTEVYP